MLSDAIEAAYQLLKADPRLQDDIGSNVDVKFWSKTNEDEPHCYPAITFLVDPVVPLNVIALGKKKQIIYPMNVICIVAEYQNPWETQTFLDKLIRNVVQVIEESYNLGGGANGVKFTNAIVTQLTYGYVLDNQGNPFLKVCQVTVEVTEQLTINENC